MAGVFPFNPGPFYGVGAVSSGSGGGTALGRDWWIWAIFGANALISYRWFRALGPSSTSTSAPQGGDDGERAALLRNFTLSLHNARAGRWWTVVTAAFSHIHPAHLFSNMSAFLMAAAVGTRLRVGAARMLLLALGSAAAGSGTVLFYQRYRALEEAKGRRRRGRAGKGSGRAKGTTQQGGVADDSYERVYPLPAQQQHDDQEERAMRVLVQEARSTLGASGMVMGMLAALALAAPRLQVRSWALPFPIDAPLWAVAAAYFCFDSYLLGTRDVRVEHASQIGGSLFGAAFWLVFLRNRQDVVALARPSLARVLGKLW